MYVESLQSSISLQLVVHKPLIKTTQAFHILSPVQIVVDAYVNGMKKADSHPGCTVGYVVIRGSC